MKRYDYLIVGSGISGAVFARQVTDKGKRCLVLERRPHIGGNVYTREDHGITVHEYGAHIFHTSSEKVWQYVNRFCNFHPFVNTPIANYRGVLYNLPFNMHTFYQMWGVTTPDQARTKIASQIAQYTHELDGEPKNLEEQAISLVGFDLYEKLIKGYTEKQWGRPCDELPAFIIKRIPVRFTYNNNYFNDRHQGIPEEGYTAFVEQLLAGIEVKLCTDFLQHKAQYIAIAETIVYTGMLDAFYDDCYGPLEYRSLEFQHMIIAEESHQGVAVMNYTDEQTPYTRSIEHKHFMPETSLQHEKENTIVTKEFPCKWEPGKEAFYPINDEENQARYEKYAELAAHERNVLFLGRLANYRYYDMDKAILASLKVAEKIT